MSRLKWYVSELSDVFMKLKAIDSQMEEIILEIGETEDVDRFYEEKDERNENDSLRLHELKEFVENEEKKCQRLSKDFLYWE